MDNNKNQKNLRFITALIIDMLAGVEVDIFVPSLPEIQQLFGITPFVVSMLLSINFIAYCISCLIIGTLGDKFNRKNLILGSLSIFIIGSILCLSTNSFYIILIGRALQGIGIAGPAVLGYLIIADEYSLKEQQSLIGLFNGIATLSMACAPIAGSFIASKFGWQGNFTALLLLGILCFIMSYFTLVNSPATAKNEIKEKIHMSPYAYLPVIKSSKFMLYTIAICLSSIPFWVFIGISPLLYIKSFGVPLEQFGYYQGSMCLVFAILSFSSGMLTKKLGERLCFNISIILCFMSVSLISLILILNLRNPLIITFAMMLYSAGIILPLNILYLFSLEIVDGTKSRSTAVLMSLRLFLTAITLEIVSLFYTGSFLPIGISICVCLLLFFICIWILKKRQWLHLQA